MDDRELLNIEVDCPECGHTVTITQTDSLQYPGGHCKGCNKYVFAYYDMETGKVNYKARFLMMADINA